MSTNRTPNQLMTTLNAALVALLDNLDSTARYTETNELLRNLLNQLKDAQKNQPINDHEQHQQKEVVKKPGKEKFDYKSCNAFKVITENYFYPTIRQTELVSIATMLAGAANLKVDRDAKRRKDLLFKWFEDHWDDVKVHLPRLVAFNKDGDVLNRDRLQVSKEQKDLDKELKSQE